MPTPTSWARSRAPRPGATRRRSCAAGAPSSRSRTRLAGTAGTLGLDDEGAAARSGRHDHQHVRHVPRDHRSQGGSGTLLAAPAVTLAEQSLSLRELGDPGRSNWPPRSARLLRRGRACAGACARAGLARGDAVRRPRRPQADQRRRRPPVGDRALMAVAEALVPSPIRGVWSAGWAGMSSAYSKRLSPARRS